MANRLQTGRGVYILDLAGDAELVAARVLWMAREFEQVREAALKSVRIEKKLFGLTFDQGRRGPFRDRDIPTGSVKA